MNHHLHSAQLLFPQAPEGTKITGRNYHAAGDVHRQWFTSGGYFSDDSTDMRFQSLAKVAALTVDVDAYEWETQDTISRWGATRDERKAAMRAASEEEVLHWMQEVNFLQVAAECAAFAGLPVLPNRVIYTGQGLCLVYWLDANEGGLTDAWTPLRMKEAIKRFMAAEAPSLWWWDKSAKDVGTRLVPVPGTRHRVTGKHVQLVYAQDEITPLTGWLDAIDAKYPPEVVQKAKVARKAAKKTETTAPSAPSASSGDWKVVAFDPAKHIELEVGGKADSCPLCGGSGYKRLVESHYSCFSCETQFRVGMHFNFTLDFAAPLPDVAPEQEPAPEPQAAPRMPGHLELTPAGHAVWPEITPPRLVNKARTGSGKTELMRRERNNWAPPSDWEHRVLAVSPTIALAKNLSQRLDIAHADAQSELTLNNDSLACCFASLAAKVGGVPHLMLRKTYIMVDEAESSLSQLFGMLKGEKARETYNLLVHVAALAGKVMLADANAGPVCAQFMCDVRAYSMLKGIDCPEWALWYTDDHKHHFNYVSPVMKRNKKGEEVVAASSDAMHKGIILEKLNEGKKLAIYIPGRETAMGFAAVLRERYNGLDVRCIVRNTSNDTQHDLSQTGLTADVLIYNNAMSTGVSYDLEHYDEVHLLIGQGAVTDGIHIEQAVHRVRKPRSKEFYISGVIHSAVNDWRCNRDAQLMRAIKRLESGSKAVQCLSSELSVASDYMVSDESQRLSKLQATILAGRFERGFRWVMPWLARRHHFTVVEGAACGEFGREVAEARDLIDQTEAMAIAQATPLDEANVSRVENRGAANEAEYHAFQAAKMQAIYGKGFSAADDAGKARVAHETKRSRLAQKVRVFAAARMLLGSTEDRAAVAASEVRGNKDQTVMTAQVILPSANCFSAVLLGLNSLCTFDAGGHAFITPSAALGICREAIPHMQFAGIKPREDMANNPFRQLASLLSLGGLKLRSTRVGPQGARERLYFLASPDLERLGKLADAFCARWREAVSPVSAEPSVEAA